MKAGRIEVGWLDPKVFSVGLAVLGPDKYITASWEQRVFHIIDKDTLTVV